MVGKWDHGKMNRSGGSICKGKYYLGLITNVVRILAL